MSDTSSPPRETLVRAAYPAVEFRDAGEADLADGHLGLMRILFSPVGEWTEINSMWEGQFMERFAPGAWRKTIREQSSRIRSLFQHGMDPQIGDKPLGPISLLEENDRGGYGEVPLLDTSYNRDLLPGLKAGLYGASHRFRVMREDEVSSPEPSDYNPRGLPERTIKEAQLMEFGPVTFPAYQGATAGVRSLTDEFLMRCFDRDSDRLRGMFEQHVGRRMDSEDVGTLAQMLMCASSYIEEQDEEDATELAAITAMQAIQADLIKLMNVEAVEDEPDEPEDERATKKDPAPSSTDAAPQRTSGTERRDTTSSRGPLVLPARPPRSGISLPNQKKEATWPLR